MMDYGKENCQKLLDEKIMDNDYVVQNSKENTWNKDSNVNLEASLEQIRKMEVILEMKVSEEEKAKLCRMNSEEECRKILRNLACHEISDAFKNNLQEFLDLLDGSEKINYGKERSIREKENENFQKYESRSCRKAKKFIERNIQLAQSGRGVLSLTDKERQRIENLLLDDDETDECIRKEDSEGSSKNVFNGSYKNAYGFDDDSKILLKRIDKHLEAFSTEIPLNTFSSKQMSIEDEITSDKIEQIVSGANDNIDENKFGENSRNERYKLEKIEKLLSDLKSD